MQSCHDVDSSAPIMIMVDIRNQSIPPILGESYYLTCAILGANDITDFNIKWIKNNLTLSLHVGSHSTSLTFSTFKLSDSGKYTCQATVNYSDATIVDSQDINVIPQSKFILAPIESLIIIRILCH